MVKMFKQYCKKLVGCLCPNSKINPRRIDLPMFRNNVVLNNKIQI